MTGNQYQELAMRTNDGKSTERLGKALWSASQVTLEQSGFEFHKLPGKEHIDFGGFMMACLGLSGEVGERRDSDQAVE